MLIKIVRFILIPVFVLSLMGSSYYIVKNIKVSNWHKTTLTVTSIRLPAGSVYGDYTDGKGDKHYNESAFIRSSFSRFGIYRNKIEDYYGSTFNVLVDPETGRVLNYDDLFINSIICFGITTLTGTILFLTRTRREHS